MDKQELLEIIKNAKVNNGTLLFLWNKQISELPAEIADLTNLQSLYLNENKLSELPNEIAGLSNLQILSLSGNKLSEVPNEIAGLTKLQSLYLDRNQLSELRKEIANLTNLQILSVGGNQLSELPNEIAGLINLQELYLNGNQLSVFPNEIAGLTNLQSLYLDRNQLSELPKEIANLTNLQILSVDGNQLSEVPNEIAGLSNLQELYLNGNQLSVFPNEIAGLTNLQSLYLNENQLSELPKEIANLTNLQILSVGGNQLSEVPNEIAGLINLQELYLNENQLSVFPNEIAGLTNLQSLSLRGNQLSELPAEIANLTNLQTLALSGNKLSELPNEIAGLTNLQTLFLDETQLKNFAENLLLYLKNTEFIIIDENDSYSIPVEISAKSTTARELIDYYLLIKKGGRELNEAKVLVVGQGSVGKTSLIKRLVTGNYNPQENKTEGIDINTDWKVEVNNHLVQLNIWDFGGQEIMHATHQFFLTKRSLYILVLDARLDKEENRLDYWLEKIKSLGGDSPVIIVGNKIDQHPLDINQEGLRKKYPNIRDIFAVSCNTGKDLEKLKEFIVGEVGNLNGIHDFLPASWFAVKEELEKFDEDYIPYEKFEEICNQKDVDEAEFGRLIRLLHDLGIVLNFRDDDTLGGTNVLNPEWVTKGVYSILNYKELFKTKGVLKRSLLSNILDTRKYPKTKQLFIIEMMKKFELCFDIKPNQVFLIPDLLDENELDTGDWMDALKFQYRYKVYFNSIITRFIVRMHENISLNTYWRSGVVLIYQDGDTTLNRALVKADSADRIIYISVKGNESTRREFLSQIRRHFDEIHNTFTEEYVRDNITRKVPIPGRPDFVVDYEHLLNLEKAGKEFVTPEGLVDEYSIRELLSGIETNAESAVNLEVIPSSAGLDLRRQNLLNKKNELDPPKNKIDGKAEIAWIITKIILIIPIIAGLSFLIMVIYNNWDEANKHIQSAQNVGALVLGVIAMSLFFVFGGRENFNSFFKRINEIGEDKFKAIGYGWGKFEIDEYNNICRELNINEKPKS